MATIDKDLLLDKIDRLLKLHNYAREDWFANAIHNTVWDAPEIETDHGWIPCSERLPKEEKKTYWVCTDTEHQCECRWTNNRFGIGEGEWGWSIFDTPQYTKPVAWMPLPTPYKGGDADDV